MVSAFAEWPDELLLDFFTFYFTFEERTVLYSVSHRWQRICTDFRFWAIFARMIGISTAHLKADSEEEKQKAIEERVRSNLEVRMLFLKNIPQMEEIHKKISLSSNFEYLYRLLEWKDALFLSSSLMNKHQVELEQEEMRNIGSLENWFEKNSETVQHIEKLDFSAGFVRAIPDSFHLLRSISRLILYINRLEALPESILQLHSLEILDIAQNRIQTLPESFGELCSLKILEMSSNKLKRLPESIGHLTALMHLIANDNQIEDLPDSFSGLTSLEELYLSKNRFKTCPPSLDQFHSLNALGFALNELQKPYDISYQLTSLESLCIDTSQIGAFSDSIFTRIHSLTIYQKEGQEVPKRFYSRAESLQLNLAIFPAV